MNIALDSPAFLPVDVPQTISNSDTMVEIDLLEDYEYRINLWEVLPDNDGVYLRLQFYESGAYVTSGYNSECGPITTSPASVSATTHIDLTQAVGNAANEGWRRVEVIIYNANDSDYKSQTKSDAYRANTAGQLRVDAGYGNRTTAVAATKCKLYPSSGGFASGYYQVESRPLKRTR